MAFWQRLQLYIRVTPDTIVVRDVRSGWERAFVAVIALDSSSKFVRAIGQDALDFAPYHPEWRIVWPFKHPRASIQHFASGDLLLKSLISRVTPRLYSWLPMLILHPLHQYPEGLAEIERVAWHQLAHSVAAPNSRVWLGRELNDQDVLTQAYQQEPHHLVS